MELILFVLGFVVTVLRLEAYTPEMGAELITLFALLGGSVSGFGFVLLRYWLDG